MEDQNTCEKRYGAEESAHERGLTGWDESRGQLSKSLIEIGVQRKSFEKEKKGITKRRRRSDTELPASGHH